VRIERPVIEWVSVEADEVVQPGAPVRVTLTLRNRSFAATMPRTELELRPSIHRAFDGQGTFGSGPAYRVEVPALAPRQSATLSLVLATDRQQVAAQLRYYKEFKVLAGVDPERIISWGKRHERSPEPRVVKWR
jgi:hypothetical protein